LTTDGSNFAAKSAKLSGGALASKAPNGMMHIRAINLTVSHGNFILLNHKLIFIGLSALLELIITDPCKPNIIFKIKTLNVAKRW
jgi:hypothetical protein